MRNLIFILLIIFFIACDDDYVEQYKECYDIGGMKCEDNRAKMCESDYIWWTHQDCDATGEACVYNDPAVQSGFVGLATCE